MFMSRMNTLEVEKAAIKRVLQNTGPEEDDFYIGAIEALKEDFTNNVLKDRELKSLNEFLEGAYEAFEGTLNAMDEDPFSSQFACMSVWRTQVFFLRGLLDTMKKETPFTDGPSYAEAVFEATKDARRQEWKAWQDRYDAATPEQQASLDRVLESVQEHPQEDKGDLLMGALRKALSGELPG